MRWRGGRRSMFIDDRRGRTAKRAAGGIGGIVLIGAIVIALLGGDPTVLLDVVEQGGGTITTTERVPTPAEDEQAEFVSVVLADTEDTWHALFQQAGERYQEPTLTLFSGAVESACGFNTAATGPFYCPGDRRVYLDLEFFQQLESLGAPGDFARAYVIGHEVGHHVQNLTGVLGAVQRQQSARPGSANALQVRVELQADCYAGVWAHHAERQRDMLEPGDIDEGLQAAAAIGDDTLQRRAGRTVQPESFTHGSAAQRAQWFRTGYSSGDVAACDTFGGAG